MAEKAKGKHKFGTLNPDAIELGITRNKKKAAMEAIGLWNDDPTQSTDLRTIKKMAKDIRRGAWQRKK
ncbi:MAG: hypothetical protein WBA23_13880 [Tunicatimonas sp.]|uniref:hypothetical protein n=1 Tax=Tunicatimonas sp. TaxID=1940096 RepID=UPI003C73A46E